MAIHETRIKIFIDVKYSYTPGYPATFDEPGQPEEFEFTEVIGHTDDMSKLKLDADQQDTLLKEYEDKWIKEIKQDAIDSRNP